MRKKLLPASAAVVMAASRIEKWPMPGRTRFLRMEVEVAEEDTTRMREASRAAWPEAAQILRQGEWAHILIAEQEDTPKLTIVPTGLVVWLPGAGWW